MCYTEYIIIYLMQLNFSNIFYDIKDENLPPFFLSFIFHLTQASSTKATMQYKIK